MTKLSADETMSRVKVLLTQPGAHRQGIIMGATYDTVAPPPALATPPHCVWVQGASRRVRLWPGEYCEAPPFKSQRIEVIAHIDGDPIDVGAIYDTVPVPEGVSPFLHDVWVIGTAGVPYRLYYGDYVAAP